jgi:phage/plasmid primase-like uncharacterized protein
VHALRCLPFRLLCTTLLGLAHCRVCCERHRTRGEDTYQGWHAAWAGRHLDKAPGHRCTVVCCVLSGKQQ